MDYVAAQAVLKELKVIKQENEDLKKLNMLYQKGINSTREDMRNLQEELAVMRRQYDLSLQRMQELEDQRDEAVQHTHLAVENAMVLEQEGARVCEQRDNWAREAATATTAWHLSEREARDAKEHSRVLEQELVHANESLTNMEIRARAAEHLLSDRA